MAWQLNPALTNFREAVNAAYPARDRDSDGTIGDERHQQGASDHNPDPDGSVDAWDMDVEVNGRGRLYAEDVEHLKRVFEAHESSKYWIHNDQISFRSEGWRPRSYAYAGPNRNQHRRHVHFNSRESHERSTAPWTVGGNDMGTLEGPQARQLGDAHFVLTSVPLPDGTRQPAHVVLGALVAKVDVMGRLMTETAAGTRAALMAKLEEIDQEATDRAVDAAQQHAELVELIGQGLSGERDATEVLRLIGERLLATPAA